MQQEQTAANKQDRHAPGQQKDDKQALQSTEMDNNIQKYMAFVRTVETGSFTRAAEKLNYAQSSVSKMIADLEKEWNVTLLDDYRKLEAHVDAMNGIRTGILRIGSFSSVAIHWLPRICAEFQKDYPGIEYEILI